MGGLINCIAMFFMAPLPLGDSAFQDRASVYGTVVDRDNHQPLSGAVVYASSHPSAGFETATTDAEGRFFLFTLLPGWYGFYAEKTGYGEGCIRVTEREPELEAGLQ